MSLVVKYQQHAFVLKLMLCCAVVFAAAFISYLHGQPIMQRGMDNFTLNFSIPSFSVHGQWLHIYWHECSQFSQEMAQNICI